jgi:5-methylcytosine-specific restriction endonuclease McrA
VRAAKERGKRTLWLLNGLESFGFSWAVAALGLALLFAVRRETRKERNRKNAVAAYYRDVEGRRAKSRAEGAAKRAADPEAVRAYDRARYARDPSRKLAAGAAYRQRNPDKVKADKAAWKRARPDLVGLSFKRRRDIKRANGGGYTAADVQAQFNTQGGACFYCAKSLSQYHIEHKTPISRGGSNTPGNIVCACAACNLRKGRRTAEEFFEILRADTAQKVSA